jgi:hypothetical protein
MKKLLVLLTVLMLGAVLYGQTHAVYIEVWDHTGTQPGAGDVTFTAVILDRPAEIIDETFFGWGYGDVIPGFIDGNLGSGGFSTWAPGEILEISATIISTGCNVTNSWVINSGSFEYYPNPGGLEIPACGEDPEIQFPGEGGFNPTTGTTTVGTWSGEGAGYGNGLPNEDLLGDPSNVGPFFTLTLPDGAPVDVTFCIDQAALGYIPINAAYFLNGAWTYIPEDGTQLFWTDPGTDNACVTFNIPVTRADVPIVVAGGANVDDALPVELTNFAAAYEQGEFVTVSWTTESESEMNYYKLYRDGIEIETIEALNQSSTHVYEIKDYPEFDGTYYYTLEAVGFDGTNGFWYSSIDYIVPVEEIIEVTALNNNYPNPFNPSTTIELSVKEGETGTLTIFNAKGQIVDAQSYGTGEHTHTWDATNFGSGIYFYKLKTDSFSEVKKMLMLK